MHNIDIAVVSECLCYLLCLFFCVMLATVPKGLVFLGWAQLHQPCVKTHEYFCIMCNHNKHFQINNICNFIYQS